MMLHFDTSFCRLVGIELPVVQAPIGGISTPALAAAVSEAGGLGTLSITWRAPDDLRTLLREARARTARPLAVNLVLTWCSLLQSDLVTTADRHGRRPRGVVGPPGGNRRRSFGRIAQPHPAFAPVRASP